MLEVRHLDDRDIWNSWVGEQPTGSILQSYEWGEFKSSLGWRSLRMAAFDGGRVAASAQIFLRRVPIGTIAYCPRGPVFDQANPEPAALLLDAIHDAARREGAIFLKVEPPLNDSLAHRAVFAELGFRRGNEIQPRSTIVVDLSPSLSELSARLDIKTRYNVGLAGRKGVKIVEADGQGAAAFYSILRATSERAGFSVHSPEYYDEVWKLLKSRNMAQLLLATYNGEVLSGTMLFKTAQKAYYMYGASSGLHRNLKPSDLLQWESLKWAKSVGCTSYDMWGIPDEVGLAVARGESLEAVEKRYGNGNGSSPGDCNGQPRSGDRANSHVPSLWGVYRFKRGFGGEVVRFVGAYDYVYSASRYLLWVRSMPVLQHFIGKIGKSRHLDRVSSA